MTVKDTSITAYYSLDRLKGAATIEGRVLATLNAYGKATRSTVAFHLGKPVSSITAAVKALLQAGIIEEGDRVPDVISNRLQYELRIKEVRP